MTSENTFEVTPKDGINLSCLSLYQGLNHHKNDHFELSVSAELLREAIIKHFSQFILSCLSTNHNIIKNECKDPQRRSGKAPTLVQLVFSFFDDHHSGYMTTQEAAQLMSASDIHLSRRVWNNLTHGVDRIYYKNFEAPKTLVPVKNRVSLEFI